MHEPVEVTIDEAQREWYRLLARVERGEQVTISRAGHAVARLVPVHATGHRGTPPGHPRHLSPVTGRTPG